MDAQQQQPQEAGQGGAGDAAAEAHAHAAGAAPPPHEAPPPQEPPAAEAAAAAAAAVPGAAAAAAPGNVDDDNDEDEEFVDAEGGDDDNGSGDDDDDASFDDEGEAEEDGDEAEEGEEEEAGGGVGGAGAAAWAIRDPVADAGLGKHGCAHYRRRCRLVAPCCGGEAFWCRHCHNAAKDDGEQDPSKRHALDRRTVAEVICALCDLRQPVAEACRACGVRFGRYACLKCNFFDDTTSKKQFHCDDCGICRVGGRPNFFHCATCNCCYALALRESHVCVQNAMHGACPVCFEYLFDSVRPITVLLCGHTIHQECYQALASHDAMALCPSCMRCTLAPAHRARMWRDVDALVAAHPMPPEHAGKRVGVLCNDCSATSEAAFHFIGNKCGACGGYNTRVVG